MKDEIYYRDQTPPELALKLVEYLPIEPQDNAIDPFKGEGAFYNALEKKIHHVDWCEIEEGRDYKEMGDIYNWIVTNPPFGKNGSFWKLLWELAPKSTKGIAFLGNQYCFTSLTPKRLKLLEDKGLYLSKVIVCNVKKWFGKYYFMVFTRSEHRVMEYLLGSY